MNDEEEFAGVDDAFGMGVDEFGAGVATPPPPCGMGVDEVVATPPPPCGMGVAEVVASPPPPCGMGVDEVVLGMGVDEEASSPARLPADFGALKSLRELDLSNCSGLRARRVGKHEGVIGVAVPSLLVMSSGRV